MAASLNRELEMTYSTDFRRRVIARVQSGDSKSVACRLFGISRSTMHSWLGRPLPLEGVGMLGDVPPERMVVQLAVAGAALAR